jgi:hypothetical protein
VWRLERRPGQRYDNDLTGFGAVKNFKRDPYKR